MSAATRRYASALRGSFSLPLRAAEFADMQSSSGTNVLLNFQRLYWKCLSRQGQQSGASLARAHLTTRSAMAQAETCAPANHLKTMV